MDGALQLDPEKEQWGSQLPTPISPNFDVRKLALEA